MSRRAHDGSASFEFIQKVVGDDRILYLVDYSYLTLAGARRFLKTLPAGQEASENIAHTNAEQLFDCDPLAV